MFSQQIRKQLPDLPKVYFIIGNATKTDIT